MKKLKTLKSVVLVIVVLIGSFPSLLTLFSKAEGPFQITNSPYWHALIISAVSIITVIIASRLLCNSFFRKWIKESHSLVKKSMLIGVIVFLSGIIAVVIGWEFNWIMAYLLGASNVTEIEWYQFLYTVPLFAIIYSVLPAFGVGILMSAFAYFFLKQKSL